MNRILTLGVIVLFAGSVAAQPTEPKVNSAAAKAFATTVLPVITNVCADCHAHAKHASAFKLRPYDPAYSDPALAEANYKAVVKMLDAASPHDSPLLKYSATAHGKAAEPPLKAEHPAYKKLAIWVHWATAADGSAAPASIPPPTAKAVIQAGNTQPAPPSPRTGQAATAQDHATAVRRSRPEEGQPRRPVRPGRVQQEVMRVGDIPLPSCLGCHFRQIIPAPPPGPP